MHSLLLVRHLLLVAMHLFLVASKLFQSLFRPPCRRQGTDSAQAFSCLEDISDAPRSLLKQRMPMHASFFHLQVLPPQQEAFLFWTLRSCVVSIFAQAPSIKKDREGTCLRKFPAPCHISPENVCVWHHGFRVSEPDLSAKAC